METDGEASHGEQSESSLQVRRPEWAFGCGGDCHAGPSGLAPLRASGDGAQRVRRGRRFGGPRAAGGRMAPPVSAGPGGQPGLLRAAMSIRAGLNQHFAGLVAEPVPASAALLVPGQAVCAGRSVGFSSSGGVANAGSSFRSPPLQLNPPGLCPGTTGGHAAGVAMTLVVKPPR